MNSKQNLVDRLIEQFVHDANHGDTTVLDELLMKFVPAENLIPCLPEEDWSAFQHLKAPDAMDKEDVIQQIRDIVSEWGGFSCAEVEATSSPVITSIGNSPNISQLAESFDADGATVTTYVGETETDDNYMSYEELDLDVLNEILVLAKDWAELQADGMDKCRDNNY